MRSIRDCFLALFCCLHPLPSSTLPSRAKNRLLHTSPSGMSAVPYFPERGMWNKSPLSLMAPVAEPLCIFRSVSLFCCPRGAWYVPFLRRFRTPLEVKSCLHFCTLHLGGFSPQSLLTQVLIFFCFIRILHFLVPFIIHPSPGALYYPIIYNTGKCSVTL